MNISYFVKKGFFYKASRLFLVSIFFTFGCSSEQKLHPVFSDSEKSRYEDFFKKFLFLDQAVYTLFGSKPMTEIILSPKTPEERIKEQKRLLAKLSSEERQELQKSSVEYEEKFWFEETWNMWEKKLKTLPIKKFLFVERTTGIPSQLKNNRYIYFVNIAETAKILKLHYGLFRDFVGFDFDPLSIVFEIKNPESPFWRTIWEDPPTETSICLLGLLFGYGLENSYPFSWYFRQSDCIEEKEFLKSLLESGAPNHSIAELRTFNPPETFLLPGYIPFSSPDIQEEVYKRERARIKQIYSNRNLLQCTIEKLLK